MRKNSCQTIFLQVVFEIYYVFEISSLDCSNEIYSYIFLQKNSFFKHGYCNDHFILVKLGPGLFLIGHIANRARFVTNRGS